jgi:hypothetical protein
MRHLTRQVNIKLSLENSLKYFLGSYTPCDWDKHNANEKHVKQLKDELF